jgi:hypothetical protein
MVKPITKSETLFFFANEEAPLTSQFAPKIKLVNPIIIKMEEIIIVYVLLVLCVPHREITKNKFIRI